MSTLKRTIGTSALATCMLLIVSCKDTSKNELDAQVSTDTQQQTDNENKKIVINDRQDPKAELILKDYFNLKNALVNDDAAKAKDLAVALTSSLQSFNTSEYSEGEQAELNVIIENAKKHSDPIEKNDLKQQREHFKELSLAITQMVAITGTEMTLYEQFCPMYDRGSAWLSTEKEIRNPYHGSQMLTCGVVQREIN